MRSGNHFRRLLGAGFAGDGSDAPLLGSGEIRMVLLTSLDAYAPEARLETGEIMRRWLWTVIFAAVAVVGYFVWDANRLPPGVQAMGDKDPFNAQIGLIAAIGGLILLALNIIDKLFSVIEKAQKLFGKKKDGAA